MKVTSRDLISRNIQIKIRLMVGITLCIYSSTTLYSQTRDSLVTQISGKLAPSDTVRDKPLLKRVTRVSLPLVALSLPYSFSNSYVRGIRQSYIPHFRNRYDDYLQFAPLALQLGLRSLGVQGDSHSLGQVIVADALASSIMMASVTLIKTIGQVERPDGSARNSFPSGHTAMAFASARLLDLEYGERYPLVSLLGYTVATSVGIGRILNNRHWIGDVFAGMGVGLTSAELGYYLSGLIYGRPHYYREENFILQDTDLRVYWPWVKGIQCSDHGGTGGGGLGLRWQYGKHGYFTSGEAVFLGHTILEKGQPNRFIRYIRTRIGWGRSFNLSKNGVLSLDGSLWMGLIGRTLFPSLQLSPRVQLSKRIHWRIDCSWDYYRNKGRDIYLKKGSPQVFQPSPLHLGSSIEIRL